jgi:hypothetical protein
MRKKDRGMATLTDKLTRPEVRPEVVRACVGLVESEVESKRGLSGAAIKAGFAVIRNLKPGMVSSVVDGLLPDFAMAMQPLYERATEGAPDAGEAFTGWITAHPDETADALLAVTDGKAEHAKNRLVKKTYDRLRKTAKDNVRAAVPGLARTLRPFL